MAHFEIVKGSAITALFDTLIQHKTLIKLALIDTEYENLSRILARIDHNGIPHFVIDIPDGFEEAATDLDFWQIRIQFSGPDQIRYALTADGGEIVGNQIYLRIPQELERHQRREVFRIDAPPGTCIRFSKDGNRLELEVINISIGGSLAALIQASADIPKSSPFIKVAQRLADVALVFPAEIMRQPIQIEVVEVKRMERKSQTSRYELGLEFCQISNSEKKRLTDLIYKLQRQYLRHRLPLDL